jgi:hypothetical protein
VRGIGTGSCAFDRSQSISNRIQTGGVVTGCNATVHNMPFCCANIDVPLDENVGIEILG